MQKTTPWGRIRATWLKGDMTYQELAEKYGISEKTIRNRAYKEGWKKQKDEVRTKTGQKLLERASDARARELESIIRATDRMGDLLDKMLAEFEQQPITVMMSDPQGTASIARAIETIARAKRDLYMLPTWDQNHRREMDQERLKLEKEKARQEKERTKRDKERLELEKERLAAKTGAGASMTWEIVAENEGELDG